MKQNIIDSQFDELTIDEQKSWFGWLQLHHYQASASVGLPSIGEMIEFLGNDYMYTILVHYPSSDRDNLELTEPDKLCDTLWKEVKRILKK